METTQPFQPFDLHRMFLGEHTDLLFLAEIAFAPL